MIIGGSLIVLYNYLFFPENLRSGGLYITQPVIQWCFVSEVKHGTSSLTALWYTVSTCYLHRAV